MNDAIAKKTQDTLGKVIRKPPLTEKLLNKPPFRFLHDIITSVIKTTGFMRGLYSDSELSSENVKDKESKMAFLQKAIDMTSLVTGRSVSARPSKIVAGHEPEKTNEFLQALAEAVNKKVNNEEYVQKVLKGDKSSTSKGGSKSSSGSQRETSGDRRRKNEETKTEKSEEKVPVRESESEKIKSKDRERSGKDRERSRDREKEKDGHDRRERRRHRKGEREEGKENIDATLNGDVNSQQVEPQAEQEPPARIPRPTSAKGSRRRHRPDEDEKPRKEESQKEELAGTLGEDDLPPQVTAARRMARPGSARPPPKVKKNEAVPDDHLSAGNVPNVIVDKGGDSDDDDQFVAKEEESSRQPDFEQERFGGQQDADEDEQHGGLVKKILETKKELEGGSQQAGTPHRKVEIEKSAAVNEATRRKERQMVQKDIDSLRNSIQTLTRSANPLGKIMDYVQEDLDQMHKELEVWKHENKQNTVALQREQSTTDNSVEPLKNYLVDLDQAISDQLDLIAAVKSNIARDDDEIEKMLGSTSKS